MAAPNPITTKYAKNDWAIFKTPTNCINDYVAFRNRTLHFIQVVDNINAPRYTNEAKSTFVQNALSNSAVPIYAINNGGKMQYINVNTNSQVTIAKATKKPKKSTH